MITDLLNTGQPPHLDDLLGPHFPDVLAACRQHTGLITRIERATGGNVSHVFRVHGETGPVIVKVRGARFAGIPQLRTDPALIADEHRALQVYGQAVPDLFPTVLAFLPHAHALVMTDVFPDGRTWRQHLDQRPATAGEVTRLGRALARVHHATATVRTAIRSQGDEWFREHTFDFCLRPTGHPALLEACHQLAAQPGQQLVLGDVAPKNLSLAAGRVAFVDLDNVHRNAPLYDVAYVFAHILLHHLRWPAELPTVTAALLDSYTVPATDQPWPDPLLARVAAGVVLYRLATHVVPYPPTAAPPVAQRFHTRVVRLLDTGAITVADLQRAAVKAAT